MHMTRFARTIAALGTLFALAGCGGIGDELTRAFGLTRDAPDEFQVTTRAPLSMPPDLQLRPPRPGTPRPQEQSERTAAEAALVPQAALGSDDPAGGVSAGQSALVQAAGPAAPADIRRKVDADASMAAADTSLTDRLMFWKQKPPPGVVVDPQRESQRLRENAALGQNPEQGDTPIIQRKRAGLFDSLF
jgi:Protein of unknown function (DUF3035)